jgi:hypothetical protein
VITSCVGLVLNSEPDISSSLLRQDTYMIYLDCSSVVPRLLTLSWYSNFNIIMLNIHIRSQSPDSRRTHSPTHPKPHAPMWI